MNSNTVSMPSKDVNQYTEEMKQSWVSRFCKQEKNTYFCEVDNDFITDAFNLYGINNDFHLYKQALSVILNETELAGNSTELDMDEVEETAKAVYGMIHARFLVTNAGLEAMLSKYKACTYGTCPRVYCNNQHLLPIGESDLPNVSTVKLFCPCCKEMYYPPRQYADIDGAFFGTTFPHVFLLTYPQLMANKCKAFKPAIYGYKIHPSSPYYNSNPDKASKVSN
ncbi:hypothetical protein WA538_003524 [Blastocystis sp. DL]